MYNIKRRVWCRIYWRCILFCGGYGNATTYSGEYIPCLTDAFTSRACVGKGYCWYTSRLGYVFVSPYELLGYGNSVPRMNQPDRPVGTISLRWERGCGHNLTAGHAAPYTGTGRLRQIDHGDSPDKRPKMTLSRREVRAIWGAASPENYFYGRTKASAKRKGPPQPVRKMIPHC